MGYIMETEFKSKFNKARSRDHFQSLNLKEKSPIANTNIVNLSTTRKDLGMY